MPSARASSAEFELICLAAHPTPDLARIRERLHRGVDHPALIELAAVHGVRPHLLHCFGLLGWETVPESQRTALEHFRRHHLTRTLSLVSELCRLADRFDAASIPFMSFKGPTLALALHSDLARREYNDIDVLVPDEHVGAAEDVLTAMGYHNVQGDHAFRQFFLASFKQYAFTRADGAAAVDLHWSFSGAHVPFPLTTADAWNHASSITIGDREIPSVAGTDLALLLAGHGTKEAWSLLKWVSDFAFMIQRHRNLDWADIHRRARTRGCGDTVLLGCMIVAELLDLAPPDALTRPLTQSDSIRRRALRSIDRLQQAKPVLLQGENLEDLGLCDRRLQKVAGALRIALTPTAGDYAALKLPRSLWPAYHLTRPFRLAFKALAGT